MEMFNTKKDEKEVSTIDGYKIDKQTAEESFKYFCNAWNIDIDESEMDEDTLLSFEGQKRKIIRAIRQGNLIFNEDNDTFTYELMRPMNDKNVTTKQVKIYRPYGDGYLALDDHKKDVKKTFGVIAAMIKQPVVFVSKLDGIDVKNIMAVCNLFLGD